MTHRSLIERQAGHVYYTWTPQKDAVPLEIVSGKGARFRTADGASWLDLGSMTWNAGLGHGHPAMQKALADAAQRGLLATPWAAFPDKARAGELLSEIAPQGLTKSFVCLSGAEANENAIKMARLVTGRRKIVARAHSYHGATLAMLSLSGDPRREAFEPGLPGVARMADPYCYRCPFGKSPESCDLECASDLESALLREGPQTVAAVILEGVTGANGVFVPKPGYFQRVREICDRHGVLFVADEVLSGFGRTGRWFAVDHDSVAPDMITCAKGLTGGYAPGGAVLTSERIARFFDDTTLSCGLTSYAHPLVCAAIVAAIGVYRDERLPERASRMGDWLGTRLAELARTRPFVGDVRGVGLLWALELVAPSSKAPAASAAIERLAANLRARRLLVHKRAHMLYLAPPLVITREELEEGVRVLGEALDEAFDSAVEARP